MSKPDEKLGPYDMRMMDMWIEQRAKTMGAGPRAAMHEDLVYKCFGMALAEVRRLRARFRCSCGREKTEPECPVCDNDE